MSSKVAVIIPAAGGSTRFAGPEKKPFVKLAGRAVFLRTIELFINRDDVSQVLLAVSEDDYDMVADKFAANLGFMGVKLARGGRHRWQTVRNALAQVPEDTQLVAVHDAVRPCLTAKRITDVFEAADRTGSAILAAPVDATVKRVTAAGIIQDTIDRSQLYLAQTPQVFRRQILIEAYDKITDEGEAFTDDAALVTHAGHDVTIVQSDASNIKITRADDLKLAAAILKTLPKPKKPGPSGPWAAEHGW